MARKPEIGNVQLYPSRRLRANDKNGYVLKFFCPLAGKRIRRNCGTREQREARRIVRECRERLLNGKYLSSGGAITKADELAQRIPILPIAFVSPEGRTWDEAAEQYRAHRKRRLRRKSSLDSDSRIEIAGRIFEAQRANAGLPPGALLKDCVTLDALEYLQGQLLDGAEGRYEVRSPNTVNSMMGAVMTFIRYCHDHDWIAKLTPIKKIDVDEVMRGRPIAGEEFDRMLGATARVVGPGSAYSWQFTMQVIWESGFRVADVMDFSWDDGQRIVPRWAVRKTEHPTIVVPSTQKNGKNEEIPMLPGLQALLKSVPGEQRTGFVVNPLPVEFELANQGRWWMPTTEDLREIIAEYSNCSIAKMCAVSEQTVRNWLKKLGLERTGKIRRFGEPVPAEQANQLRVRAKRTNHQFVRGVRLTTERVSRVISQIGEVAKIVVRPADQATQRRIKYASAHDLRRSCAERLINAGVSAETLMVIMRHKDFATTRKFYGAKRAAQSAAAEIQQKLAAEAPKNELVGGLVGGTGKGSQLSEEELVKLKTLLNSL